MRWRRFGLGLLVLIWLGGCASGGPGSGGTLYAGQRVEDLVARLGQPTEIKPGPGGGKTYIYTTENLDQTAIMGGGAWVKPDQVYYDINEQGIITGVKRYPYGKRSFIFPPKEKPVQLAQAPVASPQAAAPSATPSPAPPVAAPQAPKAPAPPTASPAKGEGEGATRLELSMSREEVRHLLGSPESTEGFRAGGRAVVVWYYLIENPQGRRTLTPLVFEGGRLSGWGENYYRLRLREISGQQP